MRVGFGMWCVGLFLPVTGGAGVAAQPDTRRFFDWVNLVTP
jgi:hypothetical protein